MVSYKGVIFVTRLLKLRQHQMSDSFAALFEQSLNEIDMTPGAIVTGTIIDIDADWVTVHAGLKSEGVISLDEFRSNDGEVEIQVGDEVEVVSSRPISKQKCWLLHRVIKKQTTSGKE